MTDVSYKLGDLRAVLEDEARARLGEHPGIEVLVDHATGVLDDEADEAVRDHLSSCRQCAELMLDLEPLLRPEAAVPDDVADLEITAAWRRLRTRIDHAERRVSVDGRPWTRAAVAASLATVLVLGLWAVHLLRDNSAMRLRLDELTAPVVNMPQLYLDELTRAAGEGHAFEVPATASHFGVFLAVGDPEPAAEYEVQFLNRSGELVLRVGGLQVSDSASLRLGMPRDLLPAGDYQILLRAWRGDSWLTVGQYRCVLSYQGQDGG